MLPTPCWLFTALEALFPVEHYSAQQVARQRFSLLEQVPPWSVLLVQPELLVQALSVLPEQLQEQLRSLVQVLEEQRQEPGVLGPRQELQVQQVLVVPG